MEIDGKEGTGRDVSRADGEGSGMVDVERSGSGADEVVGSSCKGEDGSSDKADGTGSRGVMRSRANREGSTGEVVLVMSRRGDEVDETGGGDYE